MVDGAGWFVMVAVAFTLIEAKALPDIKTGPSDEELIRNIFEAQNVYAKADEAKYYPVIKEEKHENAVLLFTRRLITQGYRKNTTGNRVSTERKGSNGSEGESGVVAYHGTFNE